MINSPITHPLIDDATLDEIFTILTTSDPSNEVTSQIRAVWRSDSNPMFQSASDDDLDAVTAEFILQILTHPDNF